LIRFRGHSPKGGYEAHVTSTRAALRPLGRNAASSFKTWASVAR
jgi:hypothetical protein